METNFDSFIDRGSGIRCLFIFGFCIVLIALVIITVATSIASLIHPPYTRAIINRELLRNFGSLLQSKQKSQKELEHEMDWDPIEGSESTRKISDRQILLGIIAAFSLFLNVSSITFQITSFTPYSGVIRNEVQVTLATTFGESSPFIKTYDMTGTKRGVLFLVNNIDFPDPYKRRNGAEVSTERLLDLFNQMGFTIFSYKNLAKEECFCKVEQLTTSEHLRQADSLFFIVLSHGAQ